MYRSDRSDRPAVENQLFRYIDLTVYERYREHC